MQPVPNLLQQYQAGIEMMGRQLIAYRQALERNDLPEADKERIRREESQLQNRLTTYQNMIQNVAPQFAAQNVQQQRLLAQQLNNPDAAAYLRM